MVASCNGDFDLTLWLVAGATPASPWQRLRDVLDDRGVPEFGMRAMSIYELDADYVRFSRGLGVADRRVVSYIFRNAMLPQITGLALDVSSQKQLVQLLRLLLERGFITRVAYHPPCPRERTERAGPAPAGRRAASADRDVAV